MANREEKQRGIVERLVNGWRGVGKHRVLAALRIDSNAPDKGSLSWHATFEVSGLDKRVRAKPALPMTMNCSRA